MHTHGRIVAFHLFGVRIKASDLYQEDFGLAASVEQTRNELQLRGEGISLAASGRIERISFRVSYRTLPSGQVHVV